MIKGILGRAGWIALLAVLVGCATSQRPSEPQHYTGTLRQWFEGQSFTPDGQTESWFYGLNEEAARKLAAAFPDGFVAPPMGVSVRAEVVGVVTPVPEEARRSMSMAAAFAHHIVITDVISAHVIPNACEPVEVYAYFDSNSAALSQTARSQLEDVLGRLRRELCNITSIQIIGAADTVGSADSNQALSDRRAAAVAAFIAAHGFAGSLIHTEGHGEPAPARPTGNTVDEPLNRNAHIVIESPAPSL